jgi:START-like superfamily domain
MTVQSLFLYYCTGHYTIRDEVMSKQLYTLEFPVRCSPSILYEFLSTPAGLAEWFADKADERDNIFYFGWDSSSYEKAELLEKEQDKFIRFHWMTAPKEEYFEFRIEKSEITNQTILIIKDFAEKKELKDQSMLWDYQVKELFHRLGN